jgi:MFS family permease
MVLLAAITYLDRVAISVLAPGIMRDLGLSTVQMGYVFSAFTLAYAAFEIPTAWWADRAGSRGVLTRIVIWWSCFTALTGAVTNYALLLVVRFLFGAGEAGAWPAAARVFSRWIPVEERGRVQGIFFAGAHFAGGVTPALIALLLAWLSWRWIFVAFGAVGIVWAIVWRRWFRDEPRDHPSVNFAERTLIEGRRALGAPHGLGSLEALRQTPGIVPLCLQYFANGYGFYFLITWLPTYLAEVRGFERGELAVFAGLPLLLSVAADVGGGWTTDAVSRRCGPRVGRCGVAGVSYAVGFGAMIAGATATEARLAAVLIAVAAAASMFTLAPSWATAIELGGHRAGVVAAAMNTAGQVGGILSPILLAHIVEAFSDWTVPLLLTAGLYLGAAACWLFIRPPAAGREFARP